MALNELAKLPEERLEKLLRNVKRFGREHNDIIVPGVERTELVNQLGQYGVWLACKYIRAGCHEQKLLVQDLIKHTGIEQLRHLLLSHFGHRAFLIKLGTALKKISVAYFQSRHLLEDKPLAILENIAGKFDTLKSKEHAFQELDVLKNYYSQKLNFDDQEQQQLLEVTGEYGTSLGERLGLNARATVVEMQPLARERVNYWKRRANNRMVSDRATLAAAKVLARSYERIWYRVQKAQEYLSI